MRRIPALGCAAVLVAGTGAGCGGGTQTMQGKESGQIAVRATKPEPEQRAPLQVKRVRAAEAARAIETDCEPGREESCDAIDNDCDGTIDEGCGYASGAIQITLSWRSGADLDLYITDPAGEILGHHHPKSFSGGHLDHPARGRCREAQQHTQVENAYWPTDANPPAGVYQVALHYWGVCNSRAGPTPATVSVAVGGEVVGTYGYTLAPSERIELLRFRVPERAPEDAGSTGADANAPASSGASASAKRP